MKISIFISDDHLPYECLMSDLQSVRRVDWWSKVGLETSPIMDKIASLFIWLRSQSWGKYIEEKQNILKNLFQF